MYVPSCPYPKTTRERLRQTQTMYCGGQKGSVFNIVVTSFYYPRWRWQLRYKYKPFLIELKGDVSISFVRWRSSQPCITLCAQYETSELQTISYISLWLSLTIYRIIRSILLLIRQKVIYIMILIMLFFYLFVGSPLWSYLSIKNIQHFVSFVMFVIV